MATRSDRDGQVSWASGVTGVSAVTAVMVFPLRTCDQ